MSTRHLLYPATRYPSGARAALAIAHPGHELRLHGWMELAQPLVFILTDGSGATGCSRLAASARVLDAVGASPSFLFGDFSDATVYRALLGCDFDFFCRLVERLAAAFALHRIDVVAADAAEGYNSVHDAWRLVVNAAVALAPRRVLNLAFPLVASTPPLLDPSTTGYRFRLDDAALNRKLTAAQNYAALHDEVRDQLHRFGTEAFSTETLWPARAVRDCFDSGERPYYEVRGEQQVGAGRYLVAISYRDHIQPLTEALARLARREAA